MAKAFAGVDAVYLIPAGSSNPDTTVCGSVIEGFCFEIERNGVKFVVLSSAAPTNPKRPDHPCLHRLRSASSKSPPEPLEYRCAYLMET